jgi:hypothetical protein
MKTLAILALAIAVTTVLRAESAEEIQKMAARLKPVDLTVDVKHLSAGDRAAVVKLIEGSRIVDTLQLRQRWKKNEAVHALLQKDASPLGKARTDYFFMNKGPWSILDDNKAFLTEVAGIQVPQKKLPGGSFYPEDATKEQLEAWMKGLSAEDREQAQWFFTVIRRDQNGAFLTVPYSVEYRHELEKLAGLLREAAASTDNASLRKFLELRAAAFLSNDYYESDLAWMDLDAPVDVTIGPYETYNDEVFGYKAAFESFVSIRDDKETEKVRFFSKHMQELEDALPIPAEQKSKKVGALAPMVVVNEVYAAGDGNMGIATAAYNLPNDERIVSKRGSKRVMLRNVQLAKFQTTLTPISKIVLSPADQKDLDFDSFFTHILAHEITHGLGPHDISLNARKTTPRQELKDTYSTIEEAKADVTGLYALQVLMDKGHLPKGEAVERKMYHTFLASTFRTLHFGLTDSHARGMAIQLNYLLDKGGFVAKPDGTFAVDFAKIKQAVSDLDAELLMIEATGDYAKAKKMMTDLVVIRPEVGRALEKLKGSVPNDIRPVFVTANELVKAAEKKAPAKK